MARMKKTEAAERTGAEAPKEGVFTGAHAVNPFTGEAVPVWIANFVLAEYGTGAVMSVPAHDQRDFEFARKYGLPIRTVIQPAAGERTPPGDGLDAATTEDGVTEGSGPFSGLPSAEARERMSAHAAAGGFGASTVRWHLRDWGFSRQRYWGTPIPIVYCDDHGAVPVPADQLPVRLPPQAIITGTGEPPLAKVPEFVNTTCPTCGRPARRETETMDTFVDSAWYYARYLSPRDETRPFDPALARRWLPVDVYVGGPEHAVMHLLYFRFWHRVMHELGLTAEPEPCKRLVTQGIVNGPDGRKMSKRWGNVVQPGYMVDRFGADTVRLFMLFAAPPEKDIDWSDEQVDGLFRFLTRVWRLFHGRQASFGAPPAALAQASGPFLELRRRTHRTIKKVTEGMQDDLKFNTGIAALMELMNELQGLEPRSEPEQAAVREALLALATLLAPFAPHVAEELWHEVLGPAARDRLLAEEPWPTYDAALTVADTVTIAVQVNGKLRGEVQVAATAAEAEVRAAAEAEEKVRGLPERQGREEGGLREGAAHQLRGGGVGPWPDAAHARAAVAVAGALALAGCGYSVSAGKKLRGGAERAEVRPFENLSTDPSVGVEVTAALRGTLARRGAYGEGARALIDGQVLTDTVAPSFAGGATQRVGLLVRARLMVDGALVLERNVRREADYLAGADALEGEARRAQALRRLAGEAARDVLSAFEE